MPRAYEALFDDPALPDAFAPTLSRPLKKCKMRNLETVLASVSLSSGALLPADIGIGDSEPGSPRNAWSSSTTHRPHMNLSKLKLHSSRARGPFHFQLG